VIKQAINSHVYWLTENGAETGHIKQQDEEKYVKVQHAASQPEYR
jgi:hypothetical protein